MCLPEPSTFTIKHLSRPKKNVEGLCPSFPVPMQPSFFVPPGTQMYKRKNNSSNNSKKGREKRNRKKKKAHQKKESLLISGPGEDFCFFNRISPLQAGRPPLTGPCFHSDLLPPITAPLRPPHLPKPRLGLCTVGAQSRLKRQSHFHRNPCPYLPDFLSPLRHPARGKAKLGRSETSQPALQAKS